MNRASPTDLRKSMEASHAMMQAGIRFIPMPVFNDKDLYRLVKQVDARLETMEQDGDQVESIEVRYFVNARTRMCKVLQGPSSGDLHQANIRQAKREDFVEVTPELMDAFRAETQKAKDAGWKAFGRTPFAKFMERFNDE